MRCRAAACAAASVWLAAVAVALATPAHALPPDPAPGFEALEAAAAASDPERFAIALRGHFPGEVRALERAFGVPVTGLNPDRPMRLERIYGGLVTGWLWLAIQEAVDRPPGEGRWRQAMLVYSYATPWMRQRDPEGHAKVGNALRMVRRKDENWVAEIKIPPLEPIFAKLVEQAFPRPPDAPGKNVDPTELVGPDGKAKN